MAMTDSGLPASQPRGDSGGSFADAAHQGDEGTADAVQATAPAVPYGEWPSPITAADVAANKSGPEFPVILGSDIWWQEIRPDEGGRTTIMHSSGGSHKAVLPAPWNARTRVHEYGGQSYLPIPRAVLPGRPKNARGYELLFANFADQRLYLAGPGTAAEKEAPQPLTPDPVVSSSPSGSGTLDAAGLRYADFALSPGRQEVWCVQERHDGGKVSRAIVAVPLDGSAAANPDAIRTLVTGADFFAFPTPSPDGRWLAWVCWNHPHMPWDGTELRAAPVKDGVPGKGRLLQGSLRESVLAPVWRDNQSLYIATDWPSWWNIYQIGLTGEPPLALFPADEEFAGPLWQLGGRPFAVLGDGRLAVLHGAGVSRLGLLDPETFELTDLDVPFSTFEPALSADGSTIVAVGMSPTAGPAVVRIDAATGAAEPLRRGAELDYEAYLPIPQAVDFEGPYGQVVHALLYRPANPDASGPQGQRPPYVVWVHGGPTGHVEPVLDLAKAYFTSRGIGVVDVNYGGSSGYGRRYRERLRRQWGIVDVQDAVAAARWVAASAGADPDRLAIRGGSAGGWTTLAAVTTGTARGEAVFSAAVSYYGVADLRGFAAQTHDFESRYLDGLIGPLPGFETVYQERAPAGHVTALTCPILLLQGLDDPVVPPAQSESIAADLAAHGTRHAYLTFAGESHGFRKAESIATAMEAELSFYGQILGFSPPGIPAVSITTPATAR
jgi:dipeptidyl aminopeptidase/acylaminoacyl peptidase